MIVLDYQDRRPIYEQVTDKFQILILNGVLPPGSQMPSVRQLATELSVNPNTIQRAYTVSYTHLDVYKRQNLKWIRSKGDMNMGKIAIVTDSNSGITQDQARELGISVIPMPF